MASSKKVVAIKINPRKIIYKKGLLHINVRNNSVEKNKGEKVTKYLLFEMMCNFNTTN
jgi:hypothetical protein